MERNNSIQGERPPDSMYLDVLFQPLEVTPFLSTIHLNEDFTLSLSEYSDTKVDRPQTPFRVGTFAEKKILSGWFPRINDTEENNWRIRFFSKRDKALLIQIAILTIVLITNLGLTIYSSMHYPSKNGVGLIYQGDCDTVKKLDQWLHLLINVLSTMILSASNFCIQLLAAPTRADIDKAHRKQTWLDIGVPSLKNFRHIGPWRRFCWIFLACCALPFHLMYNSAVFQSLASNDYTVAVVKDSFLNGTSWNMTVAEQNRAGDWVWNDTRVNLPQDYYKVISNIQQEVMKGHYERKNISDCFSLYDDCWSPQGNVVIFIKNDTSPPEDGSLLLYVGVVPRWDDWAKNMWAVSNGTGTNQFTAVSPSQPVTTWLLGPPKYQASYCLIQPPNTAAGRCQFQFSTHIMYTICVFNLVIGVTMVSVWVLRRWIKKGKILRTQEPADSSRIGLFTLGDAIASFMRNPDKATENICLATKDDFCQGKRLGRRATNSWEPPKHPRQWKPTPKRWMTAVSRKQSLGLLFMYAAFVVVAGLALWRAISSFSLRQMPTSFMDLFGVGFGALTQFTFLVLDFPRSDPTGLLINVLVVNMLQLFFSIMYLVANAIFSTCLIQREFSLMYSEDKRKALRVSEPVGIQRSSYFITIPFRYGIPLYIVAGLTHWVLSQSFFLARITALTTDGLQDDGNSFSTCGYSPGAIIVLIIVVSVQFITMIALGCRKFDGTMRMVCTNSMAISAACHSLEEDREEGYQLPVQWGVVEVGDDGVGHCTFTTAPTHLIREPREGMTYR
ncbi:hypothetical protein GGS26DRAFT_594614 [Hypomontagnella submonticulosa]|nr:hypothetical protein GGS26DRAFT_594614 [Hypomontagnella submonticulosa]